MRIKNKFIRILPYILSVATLLALLPLSLLTNAETTSGAAVKVFGADYDVASTHNNLTDAIAQIGENAGNIYTMIEVADGTVDLSSGEDLVVPKNIILTFKFNIINIKLIGKDKIKGSEGSVLRYLNVQTGPNEQQDKETGLFIWNTAENRWIPDDLAYRTYDDEVNKNILIFMANDNNRFYGDSENFILKEVNSDTNISNYNSACNYLKITNPISNTEEIRYTLGCDGEANPYHFVLKDNAFRYLKNGFQTTYTISGNISLTMTANKNTEITVKLFENTTDPFLAGGTIGTKTPVRQTNAAADGSWTLTDIADGTYTLVIYRSGSTYYRQNTVTISSDITDFKDKSGSAITLYCGDLNGDYNIDSGDVAVMLSSENFNLKLAAAANPLCDMDCNGSVNSEDLAILMNSKNYKKPSIVE